VALPSGEVWSTPQEIKLFSRNEVNSWLQRTEVIHWLETEKELMKRRSSL